MARTFPDLGQSPIDAYMTTSRPCAWFEQVFTIPDTETCRAVKVVGTPTMIASSKYAGITSLVCPIGTGATWVGAIQAHLSQDTVKACNGYMAAGLFSIENAVDSPCSAAVISLSWKNKATTGFGGVMHSFIQFREYSTVGYQCKCLFELTDTDATAAASATTMVCQMGNATTCSHVIRISCNGVPYWIMMDSTPPA